ncbi:MAG: glycerol-3-phosphate 1-O-acyltransferase PlsY [Betaproteobacteria bacterium]|nr:glycerol-3-phosphate 1-O-acyltransferase PlsY [Betaproteobacteria bacterium]
MDSPVAVIAIFCVAGYLIGSLSFAVLVSRAFGLPDPHGYGSGNPGATNVLRSGKKLAAALTLVGDTSKGWVAVYLAQRLAGDYAIGDAGVAGVAIAAFLGHLFPLYFGFRGGKGVATALGILLALNLGLGVAALATWLAVALLFRISSLAALVAAALAPLFSIALGGIDATAVAVSAMSLLLIWRHRANLRRLLTGEEAKIGR